MVRYLSFFLCGAAWLSSSLSAQSIRRHPTNPYRFVDASGKLFHPRALQVCVYDRLPDDSGLSGGNYTFWMDATLPTVSSSVYTTAFGPAVGGFNVFRNLGSCTKTFGANPLAGDAGMSDSDYISGIYTSSAEIPRYQEFIGQQRAKGFKIWVVLFPGVGVVPLASNPSGLHNYIDWFIATFGAADLYEMCNECSPSEAWAANISAYIRSKDPGKLITNSWNTNAEPYTDFFSPHFYKLESPFTSDLLVNQRNFIGGVGAACCGPDPDGPDRRFNRPILGGEGGEAGTNWDSDTPVRLRLRLWTGLFLESYQGYWDAQDHKGGGGPAAGNLYIGIEERNINKSFANFADWLTDPTAARVSVPTPSSGTVRTYGLSGQSQFAAYLHNFTDHSGGTSGVNITVAPVFGTGSGQWVNPTTGSVISSFNLTGAGTRTLVAPTFTTDIALKIDSVVIIEPPTSGVTSGLHVSTTPTQAVISYTSPDGSPCKVEVSEDAGFTTLVNDVNPLLFTGAGMDTGGSRSRQMVVGKKFPALANDGKIRHRALQANTNHFVRISQCSDTALTGSFTTKNIPNGNTYGYGPPARADAPGEYNIPYLSPTDRSQQIVDYTGALIRRVSLPGDSPGNPPQVFEEGNKSPCSQNVDGNGYFHCVTTNGHGAPLNVYAIHGTTGVARFIGKSYTSPPSLAARGVYAFDGMWDRDDPNVFYYLYDGTYVIKITLTGNDVEVAGDTNIAQTSVNLTDSPTFEPLIVAFNNNYDPSRYSCDGEAVQNQYLIAACKASGQESDAWVVAFNLTTGSVQGAIRLSDHPLMPGCNYHALNRTGHQNVVGIVGSYGNSASTCPSRTAGNEGIYLAWDFVGDPSGLNPPGSSLLVRNVPDRHTATRDSRRFVAMSPYTAFIGTDVKSAYSKTADFTIDGTNWFADARQPMFCCFFESHVSYNQGGNPIATETNWVLDHVPYFGGDTFGKSATRVPGQSNTFVLTGDSEYPWKPYSSPMAVSCGQKPVVDISGPNAQVTDATPYSYAFVRKAGEGYPGSQVGQLVISCPNTTSLRCENNAFQQDGDLCGLQYNPFSMGISQIGFTADNYIGTNGSTATHGFGNSRQLSSAFYRFHSPIGKFINATPLGNSKWALFMVWDPVNEYQVMLLKIPPQPTADSVKRDNFLTVTTSVKPPAGQTVLAKFGYDDNLQCTSRREGCVKGSAPGFGFESDNVAKASGSRVSISIPVVPASVLHFRLYYYDSQGRNVAQSGITRVAVN